MGKSLLTPPTWGNIADAAFASMKADRDRLSRQASWDNLPTWDDLNNTREMWILRVRSSWAAVGCSDEQIEAEAMRLYQESRS
jgi:hypothetical protein